jgi:DNA-binding NarL/FixJ family response regulator
MTLSEHRTAVLLDQHPLWLDAVEHVLHRIGIEVTGKATSPGHAVALIEEHRPNLFVTGLEMDAQGMDGIECLGGGGGGGGEREGGDPRSR